jgi:DNA-binding transcriptional LysR family regulator
MLMRKLHRLIHSPHHLFTFEVCGRCLSFTKAAAELGVSQPAISLAIRQLEAAIGLPLFIREHRSVRLTDAGKRLHIECSLGLERIYAVANDINKQNSHQHVTLSVSTAFASHWVVPRLAALHRDLPNIDLRLQVADRDLELSNPQSSLGIRNNVGVPTGYHSHLVAKERLTPVASKVYLDKASKPSSIKELSEHFLIHLEEPYRKRTTWREWFDGVSDNIEVPIGGTKLNDYALVVQAAVAGEGIALGWSHIVQDLLDKRVLEIALDKTWSSGNDTWIIWSSNVELSKQTIAVRDWIISASETKLVTS